MASIIQPLKNVWRLFLKDVLVIKAPADQPEGNRGNHGVGKQHQDRVSQDLFSADALQQREDAVAFLGDRKARLSS